MGLSIVIPTWCEVERITATVAAARAVADEVVVADGGSPDGTGIAARRAGARVIAAPRGRGTQLDAGARYARGEVLLFLHADARLPAAARPAIDRALADPAVVGGNFRVRFEPRSPAARLYGWANDVRRRWLGIYYGDSAPFVRRAVYERLGGFPHQPIMEDYALLRRMERAGRTAYLREVEVAVSARRFEGAPLRALGGWALVQGGYSFGASPRSLARLYADIR